MRITTKIAGALAAGITALAIAPAPASHADYAPGCETIRWGFLGSQRRTLCDGPIGHDTSWLRARVVWTPAHYVPLSCSSSRYSSSCYGGYHVDQSVQAQETYPVTPDTVLPDEPGHLPPGTNTIR